MDNVNATADSIADAGHKSMVMTYGGKATDQLNRMHYETYCVSAVSADGDLKPEKLPPTERTIYFHSLRVHLQSVVLKYL